MVYAYAPAMPDKPEIPQERIYDALDLMVQAGWVSKYVRDPNNMTVHWTEHGRQAILAVFAAFRDLNPEKLDNELWWAVAFVAHLRFGPGGKGFDDLGLRE